MSIKSVLKESNDLIEHMVAEVPVVANGEKKKVPVFTQPTSDELLSVARKKDGKELPRTAPSQSMRIGITAPNAVYVWGNEINQMAVQNNGMISTEFDMVFIWEYASKTITADTSRIAVDVFVNEFASDEDHYFKLIRKFIKNLDTVVIGSKVFKYSGM